MIDDITPTEAMRASDGLGPVLHTARGFEIVQFADSNGAQCSLQASSRADHEKPGTSAIWLGPTEADPRILATDAAALGIATTERTGWIAYSVPECALMTTRMHLDREQVAALIGHLIAWLDGDSFAPPRESEDE